MGARPHSIGHWTPYWDPRPMAVAHDEPLAGTCHLPLDELEFRQSELPPKDVDVAVVATGALAEEALSALISRGRKGRVAASSEALQNGPSGRCRLWLPNAYLDSLIPQLDSPGRALDLGCGAGREALLMASWGWQVTAVDVLPDALEIGKSLEKRYLDSSAPEIAWKYMDLEKGVPNLGGPYGLATCFRYLNRPLLARAKELLVQRGSLIVETFTEVHRERHGKPRRKEFVLELGELRELASGLMVLDYSEGWRKEAHTARLWAMKR